MEGPASVQGLDALRERLGGGGVAWWCGLAQGMRYSRRGTRKVTWSIGSGRGGCRSPVFCRKASRAGRRRGSTQPASSQVLGFLKRTRHSDMRLRRLKLLSGLVRILSERVSRSRITARNRMKPFGSSFCGAGRRWSPKAGLARRGADRASTHRRTSEYGPTPTAHFSSR